MNTPQQILDQAQKELKLILIPAELVPDLEAQIVNQIIDLYTSTLQSFIEAEIARLEGMKWLEEPKRNIVRRSHIEIHNKALQDQISHLKELLNKR